MARVFATDDINLQGHHIVDWRWLNDIPTSGASSGHVLAYIDGDVQWAAVTSGGIASVSYEDLADVPTEFTPEAHTHPWSEVTAKPSTFPPSTHTHTVAEVTDFPATWAWTDLTGVPDIVNDVTAGTGISLSGNTGSVAIICNLTWSELSDKPSEFTPESHTHTVADVTNFPTTWAWTDLTGVPSLVNSVSAGTGIGVSATTGNVTITNAMTWGTLPNKPTEFTPEDHTHVVTDITDFPTTWAWTDLSGVPNLVNSVTGGSGISLSNNTGDVTITNSMTWGTLPDKPTEFTPESHTHTVADVTNFPTTWAWTDLTGVPSLVNSVSGGTNVNVNTSTGNVVISVTNVAVTLTAGTYIDINGTTISVDSTSVASSGHTHTTGDISDFPTDLVNTISTSGPLSASTSTGNVTLTNSMTWGTLPNKPSTFSPSTHTHGFDDITNTNLNSADDLNTLTTPGIYNWTSSVPSNAPGSEPYKVLIVTEDASQAIQMVFGGAGTQRVHLRRRDSGTWSAWSETSMVGHTHTTGDITNFPTNLIQTGDDASLNSLDVNLTLDAGIVRSDGDVYVNYDGGDADSNIYFYDGGSSTGQRIYWDDSASRFVVTGDWISTGDFGANGNLRVNRDATTNAFVYFTQNNNYLQWDASLSEFAFNNRLRIDAGSVNLALALESSDSTCKIQMVDSGGYGDVSLTGNTLYLYPGGNVALAAYNNQNVRVYNNLLCDDDIYINYNGPEGTGRLYFYDGGSISGEYLEWDDANDRFEFSDDLTVAGDISSSGDVLVNGYAVPSSDSDVVTANTDSSGSNVTILGPLTLDDGYWMFEAVFRIYSSAGENTIIGLSAGSNITYVNWTEMSKAGTNNHIWYNKFNTTFIQMGSGQNKMAIIKGNITSTSTGDTFSIYFRRGGTSGYSRVYAGSSLRCWKVG
jgi:hypothetical protein